MRRILLGLLTLFLLVQGAFGAPTDTGPRPSLLTPPSPPSHIQRVQPAVVGIRTRIPLDRPSVLTLGPERWGSGVIFDPAGYALTVSYVLTDAEIVQVSLRDGRVVSAKVVGLDMEDGLGVVKLEGDGPWPAALACLCGRNSPVDSSRIPDRLPPGSRLGGGRLGWRIRSCRDDSFSIARTADDNRRPPTRACAARTAMAPSSSHRTLAP